MDAWNAPTGVPVSYTHLVAEDTWPKELKKWEHLIGMKASLVLGTKKQREQALAEAADVYIINRENVVWLDAACPSRTSAYLRANSGKKPLVCHRRSSVGILVGRRFP